MSVKMADIRSKSMLAIALSKLKGFENAKVSAEQYETDSEIAAEVLWQASLIGDISKVSVDMGSGTGILGIGALLLGARKVWFIDNDAKVSDIARENLAKVKSEFSVDGEAVFLCQDINDFNEKADVVLQNPPFGTKVRHADRIFLEKAIKLAPVVYSFHKTSTKSFVERFCRDNNCKITHVWDFKFPIKAKHSFHKRKIHRIDVSCFRIVVDKLK